MLDNKLIQARGQKAFPRMFPKTQLDAVRSYFNSSNKADLRQVVLMTQ